MRPRLLRPLAVLLGAALLALSSCAAPTAQVASPTSTPAGGATPAPQADRYVDARLGFSIALPAGWRAEPQYGRQPSPSLAAVTLIGDEAATHQLVVVGVMRGPEMPAAFAHRGTPQERIGAYPAFVGDRTPREARVPCLVRVFLAGQDYVIANWCVMDAPAHTAAFERLLATYQPAPAGFVSRAATSPEQQSCSSMQAQLGYPAAQWGRQLGTPQATSPARGWGMLTPGVYVCDNASSADRYLFQCTELVNRFLYERWALAHIPGNAARYYDYFQDGTLHPGVVRDFPAGSYQFSDDASQGRSAFRPQAGDLLIFQDVNNSRVGWTSGLAGSPGHVAVITAVDTTHVYLAQENYSAAAYFQALPLLRTARGYAITDFSGISNRIVRGWIHYTVNGGPAH